MPKRLLLMLAILAAMSYPGLAAAQVTTVDPSSAAVRAQAVGGGQPETEPAPVPPSTTAPAPASVEGTDTDEPPAQPAAAESATPPAVAASSASDAQTYQKGDVIDAAERTFGKGAEGLGKMVERILRDQGRPTAYITGREAGVAVALGLRYGSGVLHHKIEGDRPVYWTGPSLGFDLGGNASKTFVLVYNLYDTADLYHRFPAVEGAAYVVGGFTASYLRRGNIVLIPIRLGVGWRLGANIGYMKFTRQSRWMPF